ncbi:hypothetical protein [Chryseobacterium sp.]|uniref:hypothetical protein n=1 Tax=Chryseobacterium sp. TaxID=1871047 RepID=UPI0024E1E9FC|nr:hypothetical protein [Chryseobacterium sp.]
MKLIIPKPCHENWENMTSDEKGKFCSICSKTVHDFTNFSDEDLISSFNSDENICGRFRENQLGRNLNVSIAGKLALGLLVATGALATVNAQELKPQELKHVELLRDSPVIHDTNYTARTMGAPSSMPAAEPLIFLDNKNISLEDLRMLNYDTIETINSFSGKEGVKLYGKKAKHGVIVITTKNKNP